MIVKSETLKGWLRDSIIDTLQNYFGIALRRSCKTIPELRAALPASFFHVASKGNNYHSAHCPMTSDSSCQYQRDQ